MTEGFMAKLNVLAKTTDVKKCVKIGLKNGHIVKGEVHQVLGGSDQYIILAGEGLEIRDTRNSYYPAIVALTFDSISYIAFDKEDEEESNDSN